MELVHQIYKIKRVIELHGKNCVFSRNTENEFHEPQGEALTIEVRGLFHEENGYLNVTIGEAGKTYSKKEPKLLILFRDNLVKGDFVTLDCGRYQITGIDDLGNLHLCLDLSLEAVE